MERSTAHLKRTLTDRMRVHSHLPTCLPSLWLKGEVDRGCVIQSTESLSDLLSSLAAKWQSQDWNPGRLTLEKLCLSELFCEDGGVSYSTVQYGSPLLYVAIEYLE